MTVVDRTLGGILGLLGLACLVEARNVWNGWDGTGLLPLLVGVSLLVLMPILVFSPSAGGQRKVFDQTEILQVAVLGGAFALYVALMTRLGYALGTWLFLAGVAHYISPRRFTVTLIWTGAVALGTYLVFKKFLGMYLPVGVLSF